MICKVLCVSIISGRYDGLIKEESSNNLECIIGFSPNERYQVNILDMNTCQPVIV